MSFGFYLFIFFNQIQLDVQLKKFVCLCQEQKGERKKKFFVAVLNGTKFEEISITEYTEQGKKTRKKSERIKRTNTVNCVNCLLMTAR